MWQMGGIENGSQGRSNLSGLAPSEPETRRFALCCLRLVDVRRRLRSPLRDDNLPVRIRSIRIFILGLTGCPLATGQTFLPGARADGVIVMKKERTLTFMSHGKILKTWTVALGDNRSVPRCDWEIIRLPKATIFVDRRNAQSQFYKSIQISYPDAKDVARARKLGVSPGGDVYVHGLPNDTGWVAPSELE